MIYLTNEAVKIRPRVLHTFFSFFHSFFLFSLNQLRSEISRQSQVKRTYLTYMWTLNGQGDVIYFSRARPLPFIASAAESTSMCNANCCGDGPIIFLTDVPILPFLPDGKYLVLPSGELHIRDVGPEDGYKTYQCRTKHRLTGETRLSATKGRLVITGKQPFSLSISLLFSI